MLVLDLAGLEFIASVGLATLVRVLKRARARGGDLYLAAPAPEVGRILRITRLDGVFSVYATAEEAAGAAAGKLRGGPAREA